MFFNVVFVPITWSLGVLLAVSSPIESIGPSGSKPNKEDRKRPRLPSCLRAAASSFDIVSSCTETQASMSELFCLGLHLQKRLPHQQTYEASGGMFEMERRDSLDSGVQSSSDSLGATSISIQVTKSSTWSLLDSRMQKPETEHD